MKSGNLNFLEPSGPLQACNGTALPLPYLLQCTNHQPVSVADFGWRINHVKLQYHWSKKSVYLNFAFWFFFWRGTVDASRQPPSFLGGYAPTLYWMGFLQLIIFCSSASIICDYLKFDLETNWFLTGYLYEYISCLYMHTILQADKTIFPQLYKDSKRWYNYFYS